MLNLELILEFSYLAAEGKAISNQWQGCSWPNIEALNTVHIHLRAVSTCVVILSLEGVWSHELDSIYLIRKSVPLTSASVIEKETLGIPSMETYKG